MTRTLFGNGRSGILSIIALTMLVNTNPGNEVGKGLENPIADSRSVVVDWRRLVCYDGDSVDGVRGCNVSL
jgi:hypothetical protein